MIHCDRARAASGQVAAVPRRSAITSRRLIIRGSRSSQAMQTRATAVGSTSESRLLPVGQRGARLPALPCDDKGKGAGDESFNQAAAVCFRAHHQRRGVRHHDRDPAPRIEVMHGYSARQQIGSSGRLPPASCWCRWSELSLPQYICGLCARSASVLIARGSQGSSGPALGRSRKEPSMDEFDNAAHNMADLTATVALYRALVRKGLMPRDEATQILLDKAIANAIQTEALMQEPGVSKKTIEINRQCEEILKFIAEHLC